MTIIEVAGFPLNLLISIPYVCDITPLNELLYLLFNIIPMHPVAARWLFLQADVVTTMLLPIVLYLTFSSCIILCSCIPRISILWYSKLYFNYICLCSSLIVLTFIVEMIMSCLQFNFVGHRTYAFLGVDPSFRVWNRSVILF